MSERPYPILEFDGDSAPLIEPADVVRRQDVPTHAVACFFADVLAGLVASGRAREVASLRSEIGRHPVYELEVGGRRLAAFHPGVGAPLAAAILEEVVALGCRTFVACGGAGVLDPQVALGSVVVVTSAVRDEGTSYHYLPPARSVDADPAVVAALMAACERRGVQHVAGATWTTDALYRETAAKVARRRAEGCLTVEMEAAAFLAVARHRGVAFGQLLYGGDDLTGEAWDHRGWDTHDGRGALFELAAEACLAL